VAGLDDTRHDAEGGDGCYDGECAALGCGGGHTSKVLVRSLKYVTLVMRAERYYAVEELESAKSGQSSWRFSLWLFNYL
jgi:hypothetical protein